MCVTGGMGHSSAEECDERGKWRGPRERGPRYSRSISRILSWTVIHLRGLPGTQRAASSSLLGLAPGGVCLDAPRCRDAGALLPHLFTLAGDEMLEQPRRLGGCFLWHFPAGFPGSSCPDHPRPTVSGLSSSADFSPRPRLSGRRPPRVDGNCVPGTEFAWQKITVLR